VENLTGNHIPHPRAGTKIIRNRRSSMAQNAELIGIARKSKPRAPMEPLEQVTVTTELGVDGDYRGKLRRRQVTILAEEGWQAAINDIARPDLPWTTRRANLLVRGIDLPREKGSKIKIGTVHL
jgi:MOSC domain-containing protein YiiM